LKLETQLVPDTVTVEGIGKGKVVPVSKCHAMKSWGGGEKLHAF